MVLKADSSSSTGASMVQYYLASKLQSGVQPGGSLQVSNLQALSADGQLAGSFQMDIPASGSAAPSTTGRRLAQSSDTATAKALIFAAGPVSASSGAIMLHDNEGETTLDFASTGSADIGASADAGMSSTAQVRPSPPPQQLPAARPRARLRVLLCAAAPAVADARTHTPRASLQAHAWLMTIGWGVLIPSGIVIARSFKDAAPPAWFHIHRCVQRQLLPLA